MKGKLFMIRTIKSTTAIVNIADFDENGEPFTSQDIFTFPTFLEGNKLIKTLRKEIKTGAFRIQDIKHDHQKYFMSDIDFMKNAIPVADDVVENEDGNITKGDK